MKTPDEIKKGLAHCSGDAETCDGCPYRKEGDYEDSCVDASQVDALAYITQLEQHLAQAERERDAAVKDLREADRIDCEHCKHYKVFGSEECQLECDECTVDCKCKDCRDNSCWEWRGVCEENSKET